MKNIFTGQVETRGDLCLACRFFITLLLHDLMAGQAKLHAAHGVNNVINTGMAGLEAAQQLTVCSVYNSINFQLCNIIIYYK